MKRLWKLLTAMRTALLLMALLAVLLLLNIVAPQRAVLGDEAFDAAASASPGAHFFLVTLGFGSIPTHPLFIGALGLFFLSLGCSLLDRLRPLMRRSRATPPSPALLLAWLRSPSALRGATTEPRSPREILRVLRSRGYRVVDSGERRMWGVRNPTAPLGFALFHASFFVMCAGALLLYGTRFAGTALVVEGDEFRGGYRQKIRVAPWAGEPAVRFVLEDVEWRFEDGEPVHLGATIRFLRAGGSDAIPTRVNHPAEWGSTSVLIQRAGLAPVLWLQDRQGYTLDRVAITATTLSKQPSVAPLHDGRFEVVILPASPDQLPDKETLTKSALRLQIRGKDGAVMFDGALRRGEGVTLGTDRLVLQDLRFWAGLLIVRERGGGLLIAGFVLGVSGLVWRMLWYRREVAVEWSDENVTVSGRSDHYPLRFREELEELLAVLLLESGAAGSILPKREGERR